ncbi:MAG TPA: NADH-ubiquinone oxidoreductase-F iron-sulfur binding region domain-containing protein, partial [Miltoncostaea sp.]|nr:NADH-ubiquinone oxidoreductase-F iron-sulfur binding region domain-containing protein [Miltoncostaea sp.]
AGFPTWRKMELVAEGRKAGVVVANGTEGEPASAKDAVLMTHEPELVLEGALLAADAVGAREVIVAVGRDEPRAAARVRAAVAGLARNRIRVDVVTPPARFVTGEESALVHWLNGGPATPTATPPRPGERGVRRRPTLVQNVETLAHVALIARHGADWFRTAGTPEEPGTMLLTVGGGVRRPGVLEIALGTPIGDIVARAGGLIDGLGGLLVGGYFGAWLDAADPFAVPFSSARLRGGGTSPGAGTLVVLPRSACPFAETARVARYLAQESAGQCGPCVLGLPELARNLRAVADRHGVASALGEVHELIGLVERRGGCGHPDGAARLARSAVRAFPEELDLHLRGMCSATSRHPVLPIPPPPEEWR